MSINTDQIDAFRQIAQILDNVGLFFDVDTRNKKSVFMIEQNNGDEKPLLIMDSPVLDGDTFKDIADALESGGKVYRQQIDLAENQNDE